ncbi:polyprenyl synthetase family protein [Micrococcus luteus]|uniref:polyprenyl synthetase family protein n=1 Tax=Micrococcus luteus TaxID=1270 RepID=UPI00203C0BAA|nr:polyprenyl synthetase family protein [Micrococcus luteus]MCM3578118.1 polyprenyl synthetase family protein [Micrococcus luteus]
MGEARTGGEAALSGVTAELDAALRHAAAQAPGSAAFAELLDSLHVHVGAGKLIRPRLVELGWRLATAAPVPPSGRAAVDRLGAAFELLHTALLVHDDVIDRDTLRRGQPAVHASARHRLEARGVPAAEAAHAGVAVALIAGDVLLTQAFRLAATCAAEAAAVVFDAAAVTAAGELEDVLLGLSRHTGEEPDPDRILAMQRLKTAHYTVGAPLRAGALLAGADPGLARAMGEAGADLGAAYQVIDDVLGVFGDPGETGKSADGDLREGKATVLTAHGRRIPAVRTLLDAGPATPADIEAARRALEAAGAREHALDVAAELTARARERIAALPLDETVRAEFADACHAVLTRRS